MSNEIDNLIKLSKAEESKFADFIKVTRSKCISAPKIAAQKATDRNQELITGLLGKRQVTEVIVQLRELAYDEFLQEESIFNSIILKEIGERFSAPKAKLEELCLQLSFQKLNDINSLTHVITELFGNYSGYISPYIYQLCLSNTQSRRSRAGKTFEGIIYFLYDYYKYPFASQASIGKKSFSELGLGKVVDSILPSINAFNQRRDKTIVGTMKTTLRERWQEVVEEVARSNLPNIHLLTVDDNISASKAEQMAKHNIVLVVRSNIKASSAMKNKRRALSK